MTTIPFVDLKTQYEKLRPTIDENIRGVLEHGQFIMGPEVAKLEAELADFSGARYCVALSSGTDALLAALMALEVGPGDAVFLPTFTFTATAEVVALLGATPAFVDVDETSFNICPADLASQINAVRAGGELTPKALIAVDLYGLPADYDALAPMCEDAGIDIIGDAAQSFGASYKGRGVGTLGKMTATSFFPAKPLGAYGDAGGVLTDDEELADVLRSIRQHGKGREKYDIFRIGLNARMDTLQAAILLAKLSIFGEELEARRRVAARYTATLSNQVATPDIPDGSDSAWAQYTLKVENRDALQAALKEQGIPTAVYYPLPMHEQSAYRAIGHVSGDYPVATALCSKVLSLPMHPYLDDATQDRISATLSDLLARS